MPSRSRTTRASFVCPSSSTRHRACSSSWTLVRRKGHEPADDVGPQRRRDVARGRAGPKCRRRRVRGQEGSAHQADNDAKKILSHDGVSQNGPTKAGSDTGSTLNVSWRHAQYHSPTGLSRLPGGGMRGSQRSEAVNLCSRALRAVPIFEQWECSMGSCDCLWHDGVYHLFYTDCGSRCEYKDKPQRGSWIFCATSTDEIHFQKDLKPLRPAATAPCSAIRPQACCT